MKMWFLNYLIIVLFSVSNHFETILASKLSARRLLLPYNTGVATNYTLEVVDGGCYEWNSSRPEIATVTPIYDESDYAKSCSHRAFVSVIYSSAKRQSTVVIASDPNSDLSFRADVVVDVVKTIDIVTTTKEIALEDVPEVFEVQAKNDENDTFTCLGGIEFEWSFESIAVDGVTTHSNNLRFRKFADSYYDVPASTRYWESRGSYGQKVLLQGITTGASFVRAKIADVVYKNVLPSEIILVVYANLMIVPSHDVYLIPYSNIKYSANMIRAGRTQQIAIPSNQYYFEVSDIQFVSLDFESSIVTAIKEGSTSIILKDRNIKPGGVQQPISEIHVKKPSYMLLEIDAGNNWALQEHTSYVVKVQVFDDYHHKMHLSDNLELSVTFPSQFFHINYSSPNGTYHIVQTISPGVTKITAELIGARDVNDKVIKLPSTVSAEQNVHIYQALKVSPQLILLPWDPVVRPSYTVYPVATGATGVYHWESSDPNIASVSFVDGKNSAKPTVSTKGIGSAILTVTDNNNFFKTPAKVSIQPVIDIDIGPSILETQVGSSILLPLRLYGYEDNVKSNVKKVFGDCSQIPIAVEVIEKTRFTYVESDERGNKVPGLRDSCRSLRFDCHTGGQSRIWVKYSTPDDKINLKTTTILACHLPLKLVYPQPFGLLALGSSVELTFEGGPQSWPLHKEGYYERLYPDNPSLVSTSPITDPYRYKKDLHVFRVVCRDIGETTIELSVGNQASVTLPNPSIEKATVRLICGVPEKLILKPKLKSEDTCPIVSNSTSAVPTIKIPVSLSRDTEIELLVTDKLDRTFINVTSVKLTWKLSDRSLGKFDSDHDFVEEFNGAHGFRKWNRNYQLFHPLKLEGELNVEAKLEGYRKVVLNQEGIISYSDLNEGISAKVTLTLVDKPSIDPEELVVLNHPNNKVNLQISKGSGHFQVDVSSPDVGNISYLETAKRIEIIPLKDGILTVNISDNCVDHGSTVVDAMSALRIVNAKEIRVFMPEKIEDGKEVEVKVQLIDTRGETIPANFHISMNLHAVSDAISVKPKVLSKSDSSSYSLFTLKAEKLGRTSLVFKTGASLTSDRSVIFDAILAVLHFFIEYYQILLTIISTCAVMFVGYHWLLRRSQQRGQSVPFLQPHHLNVSSPFASPSVTSSFSSSQRKVLSSSPSRALGDSPDKCSPSSPASPRLKSPPGRPLWTVRNS